MSRCICCDKKLSEFELTRKNTETGTYLDMCNYCFGSSGISNIIPITSRYDLAGADDIDEDDMSLTDNDETYDHRAN